MEKEENAGDLIMDGEPLKKVDHFKYLGSMLSKDGAINKEINRIITWGNVLYNTVSKRSK